MRVIAALRSVVVAVALVLSVALAGTARAASNSEQVVFSGTATGTFGGVPSRVGFWIWCEAESDNPYVGECNGSMRFAALGLDKHVEDVVPISEPTPDHYVMRVASSDGSINCTLSNTPPTKSGPAKTVQTVCAAPAGSATTNSAVVMETGPS
jgi:hypothetical protein